MSAATLIDSHCHLHYDFAPKSAADLVREAGASGVSHLITVGVDLTTIEPIEKISAQFENVFHTVGVHPHEASTLAPEDIDRLRLAAQHPKCRAIGEIGLDYHYEHSPRDVQRAQLEAQLELALELGLPVVIHARDAEDDLLEALQRYAAKVPPGNIPGVIHCFTGTQPFGQACIDIGFYISFSGILTFKNAEDLRAAARSFPLERLLVETDSPYLAPIPFRGKKCEPAYVVQTARLLAELKGVSFEELARVTSANSKRVFRIES